MENVNKQLYKTEYHNDKGQLHRIDGPAIEWVNGTKEWWLNGMCHNLHGLAIRRPDGSGEYWVNGLHLHTLEVNKSSKNNDTDSESVSLPVFAVVIQNEFIAQIVDVDLLTHTGPIYSSPRDASAAAHNQGYDFYRGSLYNTSNLKNHLRSILKKSGEFVIDNDINHCTLKDLTESVFDELYPGEKDNYNFKFLYTSIRITKKRKSTNPRSNLKKAVISPEHLGLMHQSIKAVALKKHKLSISLEKELSFSALNKLANMLDIGPDAFIPVLRKLKVEFEVLRKIVEDFKC